MLHTRSGRLVWLSVLAVAAATRLDIGASYQMQADRPSAVHRRRLKSNVTATGRMDAHPPFRLFQALSTRDLPSDTSATITVSALSATAFSYGDDTLKTQSGSGSEGNAVDPSYSDEGDDDDDDEPSRTRSRRPVPECTPRPSRSARSTTPSPDVASDTEDSSLDQAPTISSTGSDGGSFSMDKASAVDSSTRSASHAPSSSPSSPSSAAGALSNTNDTTPRPSNAATPEPTSLLPLASSVSGAGALSPNAGEVTSQPSTATSTTPASSGPTSETPLNATTSKPMPSSPTTSPQTRDSSSSHASHASDDIKTTVAGVDTAHQESSAPGSSSSSSPSSASGTPLIATTAPSVATTSSQTTSSSTLPRACTPISVEGDATYCVAATGPAAGAQPRSCSGPASPSQAQANSPLIDSTRSCPRKGDTAIADCHTGLRSFDAATRSCVAPEDARCVAIRTGVWGCSFSSASPSSSLSSVAYTAATLSTVTASTQSQTSDDASHHGTISAGVLVVAALVASALAVAAIAKRMRSRSSSSSIGTGEAQGSPRETYWSYPKTPDVSITADSMHALT